MKSKRLVQLILDMVSSLLRNSPMPILPIAFDDNVEVRKEEVRDDKLAGDFEALLKMETDLQGRQKLENSPFNLCPFQWQLITYAPQTEYISNPSLIHFMILLPVLWSYASAPSMNPLPCIVQDFFFAHTTRRCSPHHLSILWVSPEPLPCSTHFLSDSWVSTMPLVAQAYLFASLFGEFLTALAASNLPLSLSISGLSFRPRHFCPFLSAKSLSRNLAENYFEMNRSRKKFLEQ